MSSDHEDSGTVVITSAGQKSSAEAEREACLVLLHPPQGDLGRRTPLSRPLYVVGRDGVADLVIVSDAVSRRHARLSRDGKGRWLVDDLDSTNGTYVNEERVGREVLRDGDQLRFGDTIFKFLSGENVETAYYEEIYRMTILDGLTGVHNKRYFVEFLERELASAHRHKRALALVMFDIDHFKSINDTHGHLAGDAVLKQLARRIQPRIRREDLFARYGGEEFAAILTVTDLAGGIRFADAVRRIIERDPFDFDGEMINVTISAGVGSVDCEPDLTMSDLIRRADDNLYAAKHAGRNRVVPEPE
ncbi:MAG TPA: GGDEF domain-containing protein [Kofleriaceae bacterium]|nr:GGDEF domain-containing protein [Kofleriaceae bacterium]